MCYRVLALVSIQFLYPSSCWQSLYAMQQRWYMDHVGPLLVRFCYVDILRLCIRRLMHNRLWLACNMFILCSSYWPMVSCLFNRCSSLVFCFCVLFICSVNREYYCIEYMVEGYIPGSYLEGQFKCRSISNLFVLQVWVRSDLQDLAALRMCLFVAH